MRTLFTLIDEAIKVCRTQTALGVAVGLPRQEISHMVHPDRVGGRVISPTTTALFCDVLKLDGAETRRLAAESVIANAPESKREVLRQAFFVEKPRQWTTRSGTDRRKTPRS